jgi:hypothetical protein
MCGLGSWGLTIPVSFDKTGVVRFGQLPHLAARLAEDAISTDEDVATEYRAVGASDGNTVGIVLDVDQLLVDKNLGRFFEGFIQDAQQVLPLPPCGPISRSKEP